jgi:hypothetical protein
MTASAIYCREYSCADHCDEETATLRVMVFAMVVKTVCASAGELATVIDQKLSGLVIAWANDHAMRFECVRAPAPAQETESRKA